MLYFTRDRSLNLFHRSYLFDPAGSPVELSDINHYRSVLFPHPRTPPFSLISVCRQNVIIVVIVIHIAFIRRPLLCSLGFVFADFNYSPALP